MCGIAGVISWDEKYRVTRETLQRMSARLAHRGPDGEGFYLNHEQEITRERPQCGFAFRRLAILDPDPRAMQPFTIGDKTIVFNGEIYNFRELREELQKLRPDYAWRTTGDTEVLLLAYDTWGPQCLDRLNGMFAFAVWTERARELFLARDRMGQKPLFFVHGDEKTPRLAFASELGALDGFLAPLPKPYNEGWLVRYLAYGSTDEVMPYAAIQLDPGTTCRCWFGSSRPAAGAGDDGPEDYGGYVAESRRKYFRADAAPKARATVEQVRSATERAVRRQLVSDVPLGVFLSGGVDSSVIAACARVHGPVQSFSIGFDDPRYDESEYAAAVAAHLGTVHHQFRVRPNVVEDLPKLARVFGVPFSDSSALPTHYLARETRRHVTVALSGDGGDELFGGYDRYRAMAMARKYRLLSPLRPVGAALARGHPKSKVTRAGRLLGSLGMEEGERYESFLRLFDDETLRSLLGRSETFRGEKFHVSGWPAVFRLFRGRYGTVGAALAMDRHRYLPNDLLTKVDRASMLHSLEVRSPFMDHELVQLADGLTAEQLLGGGPKRMLREAFAEDLPAWVFKRKKMGFAVPIGEWFRGELRAMLRDHLFASDSFARQHFDMKVVERLVEEHEKQTVDHSQRLYALLMLELWWRTSR